MSYETPQTSDRADRPSTVTLATVALYVLGVLAIVNAVLAIIGATYQTSDAIKKIYIAAGATDAEASAAATTGPIGGYASAVVLILVGILFIVLAVFVGKGKNWARIVTWVFGGLVLCCGIVGLAGQGLSDAMLKGVKTTYDVQAVVDGIKDLTPSWLTAVSMVVSGIYLIAAIVAVICLMLPPSHPYFRRVEQLWVPPVPPVV